GKTKSSDPPAASRRVMPIARTQRGYPILAAGNMATAERTPNRDPANNPARGVAHLLAAADQVLCPA
ncbi:hypothetical protein RZS08_25395, partial [Arthrospira platensis SPKY1]|nr:hypothetical protein [Arthrospira platensis SPKY1]